MLGCAYPQACFHFVIEIADGDTCHGHALRVVQEFISCDCDAIILPQTCAKVNVITMPISRTDTWKHKYISRGGHGNIIDHSINRIGDSRTAWRVCSSGSILVAKQWLGTVRGSWTDGLSLVVHCHEIESEWLPIGCRLEGMARINHDGALENISVFGSLFGFGGRIWTWSFQAVSQ